MLKLEYTLEDINTVAQTILKHAKYKAFVFKAEMGSGKTTLIKALVKALGFTDTVSSPTFSIVNEYKLESESIFHFDLYRIKTEEELFDFGIEEYIYSNAYLFIEWPELIENNLDHFYIIKIKAKNNNSRVLEMTDSKNL